MQTPKYKVDEIVYVFNIFKPLIAEFLINGIIRNEEGVFYTHDGKSWVKEEYLYPAKYNAYVSLIKQSMSELEMEGGAHTLEGAMRPLRWCKFVNENDVILD